MVKGNCVVDTVFRQVVNASNWSQVDAIFAINWEATSFTHAYPIGGAYYGPDGYVFGMQVMDSTGASATSNEFSIWPCAAASGSATSTAYGASSTSSAAASTSTTTTSQSTNIAVIVGAAAGGAVVLAVVGILVWFFIRRNRRRKIHGDTVRAFVIDGEDRDGDMVYSYEYKPTPFFQNETAYTQTHMSPYMGSDTPLLAHNNYIQPPFHNISPQTSHTPLLASPNNYPTSSLVSATHSAGPSSSAAMSDVAQSSSAPTIYSSGHVTGVFSTSSTSALSTTPMPAQFDKAQYVQALLPRPAGYPSHVPVSHAEDAEDLAVDGMLPPIYKAEWKKRADR